MKILKFWIKIYIEKTATFYNIYNIFYNHTELEVV